jgi:hypothetical protein
VLIASTSDTLSRCNVIPYVSLQPSSHCVQTDVGNDNERISGVSHTRYRLANIGQKRLQENATVGTEEEEAVTPTSMGLIHVALVL